jgi:hypothetical protein
MNILSIITVFSNVSSFSQLEDVNCVEGLSCNFNNLKSLSLQTSLHLLSGALSLFCMLRNAPILEVLDIEVM